MILLAAIECFDHEYYIRGKLVERSKHYKIKFQGPVNLKVNCLKKFCDRFKFYGFDENTQENTQVPEAGYSCWCQAMTDYLLDEGFEPHQFDDTKGIHYFKKYV